MSKVLQFESSRGPIYVEVSQAGGDSVRGPMAQKAMALATKTFEDSLDKIHDIASLVVDKIDNLTKSPDEVEIAFSLGFDMEVGAVIAKSSLDGQLSIKLTWKK
jgi:Trypsin-co-occurring domain 1